MSEFNFQTMEKSNEDCSDTSTRGSKRLPGKNIRVFNGIPMIVRAIRTALEAAMFDEIIVSTDDPEISRVARSAGATVLFVRPRALANDTAGTVQ